MVILPLLLLNACAKSAPTRNYDAVMAYYRYDFTASRELVREAASVSDEQVVLNNLRLGLAAMADGDRAEAERALLTVFDLLSTAGLNEDRTTAAVWLHEGVRIWKGEPFEQAFAYHTIAAYYATLGDWENMRAAATNALFRLTDFGRDQHGGELSQEELARREAEDPGYLDRAYTAVATDFALGFLMQAIGADLSGLGGADAQFDAALAINPRLEPIVTRLRERSYDTLLIIDQGKGPTKVAYGPDLALSRWEPQDGATGRLVIDQGGVEHRVSAVADVTEMAADHRWNNLEDVRRAKSLIGNVLMGGGLVALGAGAAHESEETAIAGGAAILAGALMRSGARADVRYLEFAPAQVFLVPLRLATTTTLRMRMTTGGGELVLPDVVPGTNANPRAIYLRLHGPDSPQPPWLAEDRLAHGNEHAGVQPGDFPWILGGQDVSPPTRAAIEAYQSGGHLTDMTVWDLEDLYRSEGISFGSGMAVGADGVPHSSYRHILVGGSGLFTPQPYSMGYKRLMYTRHPPYRPMTEAGRAASEGETSRVDDPVDIRVTSGAVHNLEQD
jgi:hypothetical protein